MRDSKICPYCNETFYRKAGERWKDKVYCSRAHKQAYYLTTEKGKATQARYRSSKKGRMAQARYRATEKCRATQARFRASEKGKAWAIRLRASEAYRAGTARYKASEKARATQARYRASVEGKATQLRYSRSPLGRLKQLRYWASSKARLEYGQTRYEMLYVEKLPCIQCGETDVAELQVDHILAQVLGGTHDDGNLQVLCKECHKPKTREDMRTLRLMRANA